MPIINGKKRYVPHSQKEAPAKKKHYVPLAQEKTPVKKKQYVPQAQEKTPAKKRQYVPQAQGKTPVEKKRYKPASHAATKPVVKRYKNTKGSQGAAAGEENSLIMGLEFEVHVGKSQINFSKITNIGSELETDVIVEGGNNDYPIVLRKPRRKPDVMVLEKGVPKNSRDNLFTTFRQGMKLTDVLIFVKQNGEVVRTYGLDEAMIISKKFSDLDANSSTIFVEKLELAHTGIEEISVS